MREIPDKNPYPRKETPSRTYDEQLEAIPKRVDLPSLLTGPDGEHATLSIAIDTADGKARRVNFWDLDKTVLWAHDVHLTAVLKMFPEAAAKDPKDLQDTSEAGWRLGNSYREWYRLYKIYTEGRNEYRDVEAFRKEFIENEENRKRIDGTGHEWHDIAAEILARYDIEASSVLSDLHESGKLGEEFLMPAMVHLLDAKTRLGEINTFMTANPPGLAQALVQYSGLWKYGFDIASDHDMVGGGKEIAIEHLIRRIDELGIQLGRVCHIVLGDSKRGDVGSGYKLMKEKGYTVAGVLVRKDLAEADLFKQAASSDPQLREMMTKMDFTLVASDDVPKIKGQYKLGRLGSAAAAKKSEKMKESQEKSSS